MDVNYKLLVNNTTSFEVTESDSAKLDAVKVDEANFHILKDSKPYKAEIVSADFISKKYTVKVNNNSYEVTISNALDELIKNMGIQRGRTKIVNAIKAPMPGLILEISVEVGQTVKENDPLLILEAMKMEQPLTAHKAGIISNLTAVIGSTVSSGTNLCDIIDK